MGPVGPAVGQVRCQSGYDPESEKAAGQAWYGQPVPGRVQDDHRGAVDQPVDRGGLQSRHHARLAVSADDLVGMPVADVGSDASHAEHSDGGGRSDRPVGSAHRRSLDLPVRGPEGHGPVTKEAPPVPNGRTW